MGYNPFCIRHNSNKIICKEKNFRRPIPPGCTMCLMVTKLRLRCDSLYLAMNHVWVPRRRVISTDAKTMHSGLLVHLRVFELKDPSTHWGNVRAYLYALSKRYVERAEKLESSTHYLKWVPKHKWSKATKCGCGEVNHINIAHLSSKLHRQSCLVLVTPQHPCHSHHPTFLHFDLLYHYRIHYHHYPPW